MVRHISRRSEGHPDRRIMHPVRDWLIGLTTASFLFLAVSLAEGYLFWSTSVRVSEVPEVTVETVRYDSKLVGRVLADYRARNAQYESLRKETPVSLEDSHAEKESGLTASSTSVAGEGSLHVE